MANRNEINNIERLQAEKARLKFLAEQQQARLEQDIEFAKEELSPKELLNKGAQAIVPELVRHSDIVNFPINFIAKKLFGSSRNVVLENSDTRRASPMRNIALGLIEGIAAYFLIKYTAQRLRNQDGKA